MEFHLLLKTWVNIWHANIVKKLCIKKKMLQKYLKFHQKRHFLEKTEVTGNLTGNKNGW